MLAGIDAALEAGLTPVKVNVVVVRGVNDDEVVDLARYGRERGVTVRFIEWMPLDGGDAWTNDQVVTQAEIVERISTRCSRSSPCSGGASRPSGSATSTARGEVGVIPSVTRPFCEQCDRIRLTADGQLRSCLFSLEDHDLRTILRAGGTRRRAVRRHRGLRGRQVGRPRHQPGAVREAPPLHEPDRRLRRRRQ